MRRTIKGLIATDERQQRDYVIRDLAGKEHLMVIAAAERLGRTPQWLSGLVRQGKVRTEKVPVGAKHHRVIPDTEFERLKKELALKNLRKDLIEYRETVRDIKIESARRWVERQEKQGRSTQEIAKDQLKIPLS